MATIYWRGDAIAVAQVDSFTPATVSIGENWTITINGKSVTYASTVGSVANVTAGIVALLQASTIPEFQEITWSDETTYVKGLSKLAGRPFTATASTDGLGSFTRANVTASSGPNHVDTAANWSGGAVPGGGDTVIVTGGPDWLYGLDQSSAGTWASLTWFQSASTKCGLPERNPSGYKEYRDTHLKVNVTGVRVGSTAGTALGSGTGRFKINTLSTACTLAIDFLASATDSEYGACSLLANSASTVVGCNHGRVAVGAYAATTVGTINVSDASNQGTSVAIGSGTTVTTVNQAGGAVFLYAAPTTYEQTGGSCANNATGTITNLKVWTGAIHNYDGTATATNVSCSGTINCARSKLARTWTNTTLYRGAKITDSLKTITFTNPFTIAGATIAELQLDLGFNRTVAVT